MNGILVCSNAGSYPIPREYMYDSKIAISPSPVPQRQLQPQGHYKDHIGLFKDKQDIHNEKRKIPKIYSKTTELI